MAGNVSVRFSVQDAEVVRKALKDIGDDGKAALDKLDAAGKKPGAALSLLSATVETVKSRLVGLAVPLGPVGSALIGMGPAGLVAAAGLGAVIAAVGKLNDVANELAAKSQKLLVFKEVTGLTTDEIQGLTDKTQKYGKSQDETTTAIERATVAWDQLRNGQGAAFDQIRKIDPALLEQLAGAKSTAEALNILATAYKRAGDEAQRAAIARAFFGKGNTSTGAAILGGIADSGSVAQLAAEAKAAGGTLDKDLIPKLRDMKVQIDEIKDRTKNIWGTAFAENQLQAQKEAAELMERIARAAASIMRLDFGRMGQELLAGLTGKQLDEPRAPTRVVIPTSGLDSTPPASGPTQVPIEVRLRQQRDLVSALGPAVTLTEQLKLRTLELEDAQKNNGLSTANAARAMAASRNAIAQTIAATRERLGVASEEQIVDARMAQLRQEQARGIITNSEDIARAQQLIRKEAKAAAEALQIRASNFPGMTQLALDAQNLNKQLDEVGTTGINQLTNDLTAMGASSKSAGDAFKSSGAAIAQSIIQMVVRMTIATNIAKALQSTLSSFGLGGGSSSPVDNPFGGVANPTFNANGNAFNRSGIMPFAAGGVVNRPTLFPFARGTGLMGEAGPEAIMPLQRGPDGRLGVASQGGGGALLTVNLIEDSSRGGQVEQRESGGGTDVDVYVDAITAKNATKPGSATSRALNNRGQLARR